MGAAEDYLKIRAEWDGRQVTNGVGQLDARMGKLRDNTAALPPLAQKAGAAIGGYLGVQAAQKIISTVHSMGALADQTRITEQTFDRLARRAESTGEDELAKLRQAVGGTLSDLELMQKVGAAADAGLTFEQGRTAVEFLRRYSIAFGKDFQQLTSTIFTGLSRGSTLMLDDAGIIIDASSDIYKGLSDVEKKSALVGDAIEEMRKKMGVLPSIESNIATETDRMRVATENLLTATGRLTSGSTADFMAGLTVLINAASDAINGVDVNRDRPTGTWERVAAGLVGAVGDIRSDIEDGFESVASWVFGGATLPAPAPTLAADINVREILKRDRERQAQRRDRWADENTPLGFLERLLLRGPTDMMPTAPVTPIIPDHLKPRAESNIDDLTADLLEDVDKWASEVQRYQHETAVLAARTADDLIAQEKLAYDLRVKTAQQTAQALGLSEGDIYARLEALADEHQKNLAGIAEEMEKTSEPTSTLTSDLSLLSQNMSRLHPVAGAFIGQINNIIQAASTFQNASSPLGKIAGAIGVVGTGIQFIESAVDAIWGPQNRREAELYTAAMHNANKALREATGLLGEFGETIKASTQDQLKQEFQRRAGWLDSRISGAVDTSKFTTNETEFFYQLNMLQTAFSTTDSYLLWARQQEATFRELQAIETQIISQIEAQERRKMQAELDLRREQGEIIVAEIERQRRDVLAALENSMEAQRQAAIRATRLQFDFAEAQLRAQYIPQFQAAGGNQDLQAFLLGRVGQEIESLQAQESATLESRLNELSGRYNDAADRTNALYDGIVGAIETAMTDMSQSFASAITEHTGAFLAQWEEAATPLNPFLSLPADIQAAVNGIQWPTITIDPPADDEYDWGTPPNPPGRRRI